MKNNYLILLGVCCLCFGILSCQQSFLDETQTTNLDEQTVFSDSTFTMSFLMDIYTGVGFSEDPGRFGAGGTRSGGLQTATDEAEPRILSSITTDIQFITGTVNPLIIDDTPWRVGYSNIRKVNQFLAHLPEAPLDESLKTRLKAEARFLRAWYYSILLKHYGGVPLIGDVVFQSPEEIVAQRNTYAECVEYIVAECDAAALDLPNRPFGRNHGRAGAGSCMALKARVLLYAASPLFNGSGFGDDKVELVGYTDQDPARWRLAWEAARAVIAVQEFDLFVDNGTAPGFGFYKLFLASDFASEGAYKGTLFEIKQGHGNYREQLFNPPSRGGGGGGFPYQELVDAFGMSNGKPITDPSSGYDPDNPYEGRDPRFYNSIVYDQTPLRNAGTPDVPVDIYTGNFNGELQGQDAVFTGTPTGYYGKKFLHKATAANWWIGVPQSRPLLRYAEVLLNFAEARNEDLGPDEEVYSALEAIRMRAGLDPYALPSGLTKEEMRGVIRNERRVELALEGHRFWDVRRWMIAEEVGNQTKTGMEVQRNGSNVTYNRFDVRKHVFRKAAYFWPLPYDEVAKSPELVQNPYY
ncbi:RagB/SusD family nutrient uptake outer membrane protein [Echinicola marina]|uniref:RagB/SusD family nutrient uptake outer membrane protein n=1 Tax=Echinicola marina TaxID=2859768 RepID=UPI001CF6E08D|nr:RagB/SusD family nutrient uptake outer membrane protein [Echinicola marina]UCS93364.1 RagB/SusD family nutrient uptake outer membrane protein [Echinicola marina]